MLCGGTGDVQEATAGHEIHDVCNSVSICPSSFPNSYTLDNSNRANDLLNIIFLFEKGKRSGSWKIGQKWIWYVCSQKL